MHPDASHAFDELGVDAELVALGDALPGGLLWGDVGRHGNMHSSIRHSHSAARHTRRAALPHSVRRCPHEPNSCAAHAPQRAHPTHLEQELELAHGHGGQHAGQVLVRQLALLLQLCVRQLVGCSRGGGVAARALSARVESGLWEVQQQRACSGTAASSRQQQQRRPRQPPPTHRR